jgi:hypothetical protein
MNVLAGFQIDAPGNKIIYADVAGEFRAVAQMLTQLPVDQIAKVGKMRDFLDLRRTATELAMIYDASLGREMVSTDATGSGCTSSNPFARRVRCA